MSISSTSPRVVVIGGGVAGLSSALHLAKLGADVTVLEANEIAGGSSGLSVGIVETQYLEPFDIELRVRSMRFFTELERDGLQIVRNGYLRLCHSAAELEAFHHSVEVQRAMGVLDARVLEPPEIQRIVPGIVLEGIVGGLFGPSDGFVDGHQYCTMLAERARSSGTEIISHSRVTGLDEGPRSSLRVKVADRSYEGDFVVNAAGAWASIVGGLLEAQVRVAPQRHQAAFVRLPKPLSYTMPSVMDYTPHSGSSGLYFRHEGEGKLIAGLHSEEIVDEVADPDRYSQQADQAFLLEVAEKLSERMPALAEATLVGGWAGLYPVSQDGYPVVGRHPDNGRIIVAGGLGGFGIQVSPIVGRLVAEWIIYGEPRTVKEPTPLLPDRFSGDVITSHSVPKS